MAGIPWKCVPTSSAFWTTIFICSTIYITIPVKADHDHDDRTTTRKNNYECEGDCNYGCCGDRKCCDPPGSLPSYTVQIIAVVGAFLVTLVLLLLCFVRYQCANKMRRSHVRNRNNTRTAVGGSSSVYSLNVTSRPTMGRLLDALSQFEWSANNSTNTGQQLVQPPPYSEHDPLSSPVPEGGLRSPTLGCLPPAYQDIAKDPVISVSVQGRGHEHTGGRSGDSNENIGHI